MPPPTPFIDRVTNILVWAGISLAAIAHLILIIEIVEWFATGQWPGWSVEDGMLFVGIEEPLAYFNVVQFALDIATDLPLAVGLYFFGLSIFFSALNLEPENHQA
ncbi:hypothetical protein [Allosphingosinicella vermicomposti]|uniref:hypothetical protein n=1 Tax=Allosphingosinicella vermicomposti TaxID=614671 RepID=UPI000D106051|nr:hypothetical protein [Allosphingosinicella vermicomposti]